MIPGWDISTGAHWGPGRGGTERGAEGRYHTHILDRAGEDDLIPASDHSVEESQIRSPLLRRRHHFPNPRRDAKTSRCQFIGQIDVVLELARGCPCG